jgi:hypothetical protein
MIAGHKARREMLRMKIKSVCALLVAAALSHAAPALADCASIDIPYSAAELGAFFGLLRLEENKREVWVDVVRSPHTAWLAPVESLSRRQAVALGYMRMLAD